MARQRRTTLVARVVRRHGGRRAAVCAISLSVLLLPSTLWGAERNETAELVAARAHDALARDCSNVTSDDPKLARSARKSVRGVHDDLSRALEDTRKVYLVYWRGVLAQCLQDRERALDDLETFLDSRAESAMWASLVEDAERRVHRLRTELGLRTGPAPNAVPIAATAGLGAAAGVFAGLAGWQWTVSQEQAQLLYDGVHIGIDAQPYLNAGEAAGGASAALTGLAIGSGAGAAVLGVVSALRSRKVASVRSQRPVVAVVPVPGGVVLRGRW